MMMSFQTVGNKFCNWVATAVLSVSTMIMGLAMVGKDNCVVGTDPTIAATAVAYLYHSNFQVMIFPGMWYLRVSWKSSLPSSIKTGSCGIKGKDLGNEDYNMEKLANFLVGILYGCCMDLVWKLTINFSKHENSTSFPNIDFVFIPIWTFKILNMDFPNLGKNIMFGNKQNLIWMFW